MLTYMRCRQWPALPTIDGEAGTGGGGRGGEGVPQAPPLVSHAAFSSGFSSKATYLTPPLSRSRCQAAAPAHPLLRSQPLTRLKKARMTHRISL